MVMLACVDTVRVHGFRPEAPARGRNEVLVAHLVPVPALQSTLAKTPPKTHRRIGIIAAFSPTHPHRGTV